MVITYEINRDYNRYMNFLMPKVYNAFFHKKFPKVLPQMKEMLQFSLEKRIGDWFLLEQGTIIRLYGFVHQPYIFPTFFTIKVLPWI